MMGRQPDAQQKLFYTCLNLEKRIRKGIFKPSDFVYNPNEGLFICPAGELLEPRKFKNKRNHFEYSLPAKVCNNCILKPQCTRSKQGRTVKRHVRQDDLDQMLIQSQTRQAKGDIKKRQHLIERSFAYSTRYGYQRARWRRLWRVKIQEYLTSAIQNIMVLVRNIKEQDSAVKQSCLNHGLMSLYLCATGPISGQGSTNYGYFADGRLNISDFGENNTLFGTCFGQQPVKM